MTLFADPAKSSPVLVDSGVLLYFIRPICLASLFCITSQGVVLLKMAPLGKSTSIIIRASKLVKLLSDLIGGEVYDGYGFSRHYHHPMVKL